MNFINLLYFRNIYILFIIRRHFTRTNKGRIKNSSYNNNIFQKIINDDDSFRSKKSSIKIKPKERTISPKISEIN